MELYQKILKYSPLRPIGHLASSRGVIGVQSHVFFIESVRNSLPSGEVPVRAEWGIFCLGVLTGNHKILINYQLQIKNKTICFKK
jgi:hypothetical protein